MASPPGALRQLWYKWKKIKLPWRRQTLVGFDLAGNTFWEFRDVLRSGRMRRIAKYPSTAYHSDVKVTPQWMQWLRHTREDPPSLEEQQQDVVRQIQMRQLAQLADERWAAKPSALDRPDTQQMPELQSSSPADYGVQTESDSIEGVTSSARTTEDGTRSRNGNNVDESSIKGPAKGKESPWNTPQTSNPGDDFQPQAWTPGSAQRRG
ncbi:hypothetical protein EJ05DRAFT_485569 [Pseudovirgaria hyperparasitica]|uniref:Uncharacterized protein n=1 Tax=Pseudovirgaria hyperparasitica TaxID=470096 RepID=A0A6A6W930_9PEZI|nr:uncharacterized protein EJ05DRAFT_485569 [Pseudovirgaria hyperparasitica]KAF2758440.1 hypothetical protein EJ05DRAFT_485569 [Pseudovirgaria hyperparasitica]